MEEMKKVTPRTLAGFMELLPAEQILFNQMSQAIKQSYERFGFLPLDTPIIESAEILLAKTGGETGKQIYSFTKGDSNLALRFDLTVPLAKYVAINANNLAFPFRRYQIGKVYRGERQQAGRFREFYQADIDIVGDGKLGLMNDAEIPAIIYTTFKELGFNDFTIRINNRKILNGLFEFLGASGQSSDIMRAIDKLDKTGADSVKADLAALELKQDSIGYIMNFVAIKGSSGEKVAALEALGIENELFKLGIDELKFVINGIKQLGVPDANFEVDLTIARGLDYYTGTVYETFLNQYREVGSVCSGGRYDNLAEFYTDKKYPGVGISIGLTRLFYQLNKMNLITAEKKSISDVLLIPMDEQLDFSLRAATTLRQNGINTEIYLDDKKLKAKFSYADKLKIPFAVVIGENERNCNMVTLKNMVTGEQTTVSIQEAIAKIKGA